MSVTIAADNRYLKSFIYTKFIDKTYCKNDDALANKKVLERA